jgi:hypothetical protein
VLSITVEICTPPNIVWIYYSPTSLLASLICVKLPCFASKTLHPMQIVLGFKLLCYTGTWKRTASFIMKSQHLQLPLNILAIKFMTNVYNISPFSHKTVKNVKAGWMKLHHMSMTYNHFQHTSPHLAHLIQTNICHNSILRHFSCKKTLPTYFCVLKCHKNKYLAWLPFQGQSQNITLVTNSILYRNVRKILPFMPYKDISHCIWMVQPPMLTSQNWRFTRTCISRYCNSGHSWW